MHAKTTILLILGIRFQRLNLRMLTFASVALCFHIATSKIVCAQGGRIFAECVDCPLMVSIPGGMFNAGPSDGEEGREGVPSDWKNIVSRKPNVLVKDFSVSQYPITVAQFRVFADEVGHMAQGCVNFDGRSWKVGGEWSWRKTSFTQTDDHPVVCVNWHDANSYVNWLNKKTGAKYRLLSELEWEYAARARTNGRRYWGDDESHAKQCLHANGADLSYAAIYPDDQTANRNCDDGFAHTSPVGSFLPNDFGLYDILGNVTEWVEDCFTNDFSGASGGAHLFPHDSCSMRVLRGGAWSDPPWGIRAADRYRDFPTTRCMGIGFRVARDS